jgi:hemoglobin/transferrin/lactoferrin receptor protein
MKYILTTFLMLASLCTAYSQTVTIVDEDTGNPIELATLISQKPNAIATTNSEGKADITNLKGADIIQIHMYGYKTRTMSYADIEAFNFKIILTKDNFNLDEVVVSATRWRQYAKDIPSKIASISPQQVTFQNPQTAADMLGISGKVYVQKSQQGGGSPMIRGFATNRLLYTVDGIRMNTAIFRGGNIQNVINLDPFAVEDTEVLFGPGSVIYGSDAIGGVMSFQTLRPQLSLVDSVFITGNATTRYASANNEKTAHFDVNVGWEKWALVTSISSWDYDHLRQGSNGPEDYIKPYYVQTIDSVDQVIRQEDPLLQIPSGYSQINMMQKIRFKPSDNLDINYGFHYSETTLYGRYDRHNRRRNDAPRYAIWNYGPQKWMMNNLNINHHKEGILYDDLSLRLAQQGFEESRIDRSFNSTTKSEQVEMVDAYSLNLDLSKKTSDRNSVFYGVEYVLNDVTSTGEATNIDTGVSSEIASRYPQANWQSLGVYINNEFKPGEKLTLQTGIRYNQFILDAEFDTTFYPFPFTEANLNNGALTGSIGAVFKPTESWIIRANLGTAFRSPNVDDIGKVFDSEPGAVTIPNPALKAEYAYNADLGFTKIFDNVLKVDLTAYYTILENALVRRDFQLNGNDSIFYDGQRSQVQSLQNAAVANVWGIQAGAELKIAGGFSLSTDLNYQQGEEELDDGTTSVSRHAAPFFGINRLNYKKKALQLQFYHSFQGERSAADMPIGESGKDEIYAKDANGNNYAPAWYTLNFKALYQFTDIFSLSAGVENITDQRYRPYSSGLSGAGRNYIISLKASF